MGQTKILHRAIAALIALILCFPAFAENGVGVPSASDGRQYRSVAFTGQFLHRDDHRFRIAAAGFTFRSGVMLQSRDPAIHNLRWFDGSNSSGLLSDGSALVLWPSLFAEPLVREVRVARTAELAGQYLTTIGTGEPAGTHPNIRGYRYVTSTLVGPGYYLGLWQKRVSPVETLIVSFHTSGAFPYVRMGTVPLRLNSLFISSPRHNVSWDVTFTSEASGARPLYILHYVWMPAYFRPLANPGVAGAR